MSDRTCSIDGCTRRVAGRGMCSTHYRNVRLYGRIEGAPDPICRTCEEVFAWRKRGGQAPHYCSPECDPKYNPRTRACKTCGDRFDRGATNRVHCSDTCMNRWRHSRKTSQALSPESFARDCVRCGELIDFDSVGKGGRRPRLNTKTCPKCRRRPSPANGITVADLVERDGSDCAICGLAVDLDLAWPHRMSATRDHIIPVIAGGPDVIENLQLAHFICNVRKSDRVG